MFDWSGGESHKYGSDRISYSAELTMSFLFNSNYQIGNLIAHSPNLNESVTLVFFFFLF